jgi:hypothetical protein
MTENNKNKLNDINNNIALADFNIFTPPHLNDKLLDKYPFTFLNTLNISVHTGLVIKELKQIMVDNIDNNKI